MISKIKDLQHQMQEFMPDCCNHDEECQQHKIDLDHDPFGNCPVSSCDNFHVESLSDITEDFVSDSASANESFN
jgi:hypothetical protein